MQGGYLHYVTSEMPGTLIVSLYLLYRLLGPTAFVAVRSVPPLSTSALANSQYAQIVILVLMTPVQGKIGTLLNRYQQQVLAASDERLALASEVIGQIRIVKFFAWEEPFLAKMDTTRRKELAALWKRGLTIVGTTFLALGAPIVVSVAVFVTHTQGESSTGRLPWSSIAQAYHGSYAQSSIASCPPKPHSPPSCCFRFCARRSSGSAKVSATFREYGPGRRSADVLLVNDSDRARLAGARIAVPDRRVPS